MKKHFLSFFVLLLAAMNLQFVHAATIKTFAIDESGLFNCQCTYESETETYKVTVLNIEDFYSKPEAIKDLVFPAKIHAKFVKFDGTNDKDGDFEYEIQMGFFSGITDANQLIETITFEEGVHEIPNYFFSRDVEIDESMYEDYLTNDATKLREVSIPASVTSIGVDAFRGHVNLEKVTIAGEGLITIGDGAFESVYTRYMGMPHEWKSKLQPFALPASVESIGDKAFKGHVNFKKFTIPEKVNYIGSEAFANAGIEELTLDKCIGIAVTASPFDGCPLKKVTFVPVKKENLVAVVPSYLFAGITSQFDVEFQDADKDYQSIKFEKKCFYNSNIKSVTLPTSFKKASTPDFSIYFDDQSFANTFFFKNLDLASAKCEDVVVFAEQCFEYSGLQTITFNNKVAKIGKNAFHRTNIVEFTLPQYINPDGDEARIEIYKEAFYDTQKLEMAHILSSVSSDGVDDALPSSLFYTSGLKKIELHASIKKIGDQAFYGSGLTEFTGGENLEELGVFGSVFAECKELKTVDLSKTKLKDLNEYMFENDAKLEKCELPASMMHIHQYAFSGAGLTEFVAAAAQIDKNAFVDMPNLVKISFPDEGYSDMLTETIREWPKLKEVDMGHIKNLNTDCIYNCESLSKLVIGKEVEYIAPDAFDHNLSYFDTIVVLSNSLLAVGTPADAPFGGAQVAILFDENVKQIPKYFFADGVNVTNSLELRPDLAIDETAFTNAIIDTLDWHFGDITKCPLKDCQITKLTFSKISEIKKELFMNTDIMNVYLEGIKTIGDAAFKGATLYQELCNHTLTIPGSITEIGVDAFKDVTADYLRFEQGEGLTIGDEAFAKTSGSYMTIATKYPKENIPAAEEKTFFHGSGSVQTVFAGTCTDVEAYKVAPGWKDINPLAWDGLSDYKISFEIVGEKVKRPIDFYGSNIIVNGEYLENAVYVGCDNEVRLQFTSTPCPDIEFDHWADGTTDGSNCNMIISSDTVIRVFVKEEANHLKLAVKDPKMADKVKFLMFYSSTSEWVEQDEANFNSCAPSDVTVIKAELIDELHYTFKQWVYEDNTVYSTDQAVDPPTSSAELFAVVTTNTYPLDVVLDPMDPSFDMVHHVELNGLDMGKSFNALAAYEDDVELKAVGEKGSDYRYILDYWQDATTYGIASEDNPWSFKMGDEFIRVTPVMKLAGKYSVTVKTNSDALGEASMDFDDDDKIGELFYEQASIKLTATPKGSHMKFVKWNDNAGDESLKAERTILVKKNIEYVAIFEKDSFNLTIKVDGIDPSFVTLHGAGRYGWEDEANLSFELLNENYDFVNWTYGSTTVDTKNATVKVEEDIEVTLHFKAKPGTGIDNIEQPSLVGRKVLRDDHLFIERNGRTYDATGKLVR